MKQVTITLDIEELDEVINAMMNRRDRMHQRADEAEDETVTYWRSEARFCVEVLHKLDLARLDVLKLLDPA